MNNTTSCFNEYMEKGLSRNLKWSLVIATVAVSIAMVFMNVNYDSEYQMAMGLRLINGDLPVLQMWEPHQTSAFLCALLMKVFMVLTGGTTGILIYIQFMGLLFRVILGFFLYRAIRRVSKEETAFFAMLIYILISPKEVLVPEFGNMQHLFGTALFLLLEEYRVKKKLGYLIAAAVALCLQIFSYPSAVLVYLAALGILWKVSEKERKLRDVGVFTLICLFIGGGFIAYLFTYLTPDVLLKVLDGALAVEPTHTVAADSKLLAYLMNGGMLLGMIAVTLLLGILLSLILKRDKIFAVTTAFWIQLLFLILHVIKADHRGAYGIPMLMILLLGLTLRKYLTEEEAALYRSSGLIALFSFLATLILSDNALLQSIPYMLTFICISLIPVARFLGTRKEERTGRLFYLAITVFLVTILFRCVYVHIPLYGRGQIMSLRDEFGLVRSGPAMGLVTDEEGAARQRDSMAEWKWYIRPGDKIWIIGDPVDTLGYLYEDTEVAAPSVMSTPTYNKALEYYFELNPEKMPDVVILSSGFGELIPELRGNEWLETWIREVYQPQQVIDGNFWRYYFREEREVG